jgi:hypothetical protein
MNLFEGAHDVSIGQLNAYQVEGNLIQQSIYLGDKSKRPFSPLYPPLVALTTFAS